MRNKLEKTRDWFAKAKKVAQSEQDKVTMVCDLDIVLFISSHECYKALGFPSKFKPVDISQFDRMSLSLFDAYNIFDFYIDEDAMKALFEHQEKNHHLAIVTSGCYQFEFVKLILEYYKIKINPNNFHNHFSYKQYNRQLTQFDKAAYIALRPDVFDDRCMLFDDQAENNPVDGKCLFTYVDPHDNFPNFRLNFQTALLASFIYHDTKEAVFSMCERKFDKADWVHIPGLLSHINEKTWNQASNVLAYFQLYGVVTALDCASIIVSDDPLREICNHPQIKNLIGDHTAAEASQIMNTLAACAEKFTLSASVHTIFMRNTQKETKNTNLNQQISCCRNT